MPDARLAIEPSMAHHFRLDASDALDDADVGDMPLALQAKMLRIVQEQMFERVGGNEAVQT
jgi:transcriptional regulator with GAF, ATPase, and Fis domain